MNDSNSCHICRGELLLPEKRSVAERMLNRVLHNLQFHCLTAGCTWSGEYNALEKHASSCTGSSQGQQEEPPALIRKARSIRGKCPSYLEALQYTPEMEPWLRRGLAEMVTTYPAVVASALKDKSAGKGNCPYHCGLHLNDEQLLLAHYKDCQLRTTFCPYCTRKYLALTMDSHRKECDQRPIKCVHCKEGYVFRQQEKHMDICTMLPLPCPHKCGQTIPRILLGEHTSAECPSRPAKCNRCLVSTTASELVAHRITCAVSREIILHSTSLNPTKLVPQENATGPVYREAGYGLSTIYVALTRSQIGAVASGAAEYQITCRYMYSDCSAQLKLHRIGNHEPHVIFHLYHPDYWRDACGYKSDREVPTLIDILDASGRLLCPVRGFLLHHAETVVNGFYRLGYARLRRDGLQHIHDKCARNALCLIRFRAIHHQADTYRITKPMVNLLHK